MADTATNLACGAREAEEVEESNDVVEEEKSAAANSTAFLAELNLVMMVAFLTLSGDEFLRSEDDSEKTAAEEEVREAVSKLKRRRHRLPENYKASDRHAISRSQTKILDSRHGRKM